MIDTLPEDIINLIFNNLEENNPCKYDMGKVSFLKMDINFIPIDDYKVNGDFIESQAFAYLAVRSFMKLPISFPGTTGCKTPSVGGMIVKN